MVVVIVAVVIFLLGLAVGSFLNVCIYRLPRKESIVNPPSHCPHCSHLIKVADNVPLISYLLLRGRCRYCGEIISLQYPLVELATALLFLGVWLEFGFSFKLLTGLFFVAVLILVGVIDLKNQIIPNKVVYPALGVGFFGVFLSGAHLDLLPLVQSKNQSLNWVDSLVGLVIGAGLILIIALLSSFLMKREAMGGGDVKLAALLGLFLGRYVLLALFLGFLVGALTSIGLLAASKISRKEPVPFGPYLVLGSLVTLFWGLQIVAIYSHFILR